MAKLIYVANVSLDGHIEDAHGSFEWTAPIDEVFTGAVARRSCSCPELGRE